MKPFCRRAFVDKVKGFEETDVYPSGDVEARRNGAKFTRQNGFI